MFLAAADRTLVARYDALTVHSVLVLADKLKVYLPTRILQLVIFLEKQAHEVTQRLANLSFKGAKGIARKCVC
ncbi:hypothetical protein NBRC116601_19710 [Cognatishimia sp. WU-CL00825]